MTDGNAAGFFGSSNNGHPVIISIRPESHRHPMVFPFSYPGLSRAKKEQWTATYEQRNFNNHKILFALSSIRVDFMHGFYIRETLPGCSNHPTGHDRM